MVTNYDSWPLLVKTYSYSIANIAIWLAMLLDIYSLIYIEYTDE